jgi:hypothetical protein
MTDEPSGMPSALREVHRQGLRNRNDILLLSVVYSLAYEVFPVFVGGIRGSFLRLFIEVLENYSGMQTAWRNRWLNREEESFEGRIRYAV